MRAVATSSEPGSHAPAPHQHQGRWTRRRSMPTGQHWCSHQDRARCGSPPPYLKRPSAAPTTHCHAVASACVCVPCWPAVPIVRRRDQQPQSKGPPSRRLQNKVEGRVSLHKPLIDPDEEELRGAAYADDVAAYLLDFRSLIRFGHLMRDYNLASRADSNWGKCEGLPTACRLRHHGTLPRALRSRP